MARLRFITGKVTGRLGEFVGSTWKGINYLRTYAKPTNRNTPAQQGVRLVFSQLSSFANAVFACGITNYFYPIRRMTERNQVFKANSQMLSAKSYDYEKLQIATGNIVGIAASFEGQFSSDTKCPLQGYFSIDKSELQNIQYDTLRLHIMCYDHWKGIQLGYYSIAKAKGDAPSATQDDFHLDLSQKMDIPVFKASAPPYYNTDGVAFYAVLTAQSETGKRYISQTFYTRCV